LLESYARLGEVDVLALVPPGSVPHTELNEIARRVAFVPVPHFHHARNRMRSVGVFLRSLLARQSFRIEKFKSREASQILGGWGRSTEYAIAHFDSLSAAPYRQVIPEVPALLADHNVEGQRAATLAGHQRNPVTRALLDIDSRRTFDVEASLIGDFDHVLVLSEHDREALLTMRPDMAQTLSVWPVPVRARPLIKADASHPFTVLVLGSLGSIGRAHGLRWFLDNIWPEARARVKEARLEVVGSDPPGDIRSRHAEDGISIHGFVGDLEPILAHTDICAMPLFIGAGIRIKVLELASRGIPCFGTPLALQGLEWLESSQQLETSAEWVDALVSAAGNRETLRARAQHDAGLLVERNSAEAATSHLGDVIEDLDARKVRKSAGVDTAA
jgi:Glycosyl transferases group 1